MQPWGGKNDQQNGNTTYIGGLAVLVFWRNVKDKEQSEKEWEKTQKIQKYKVLFGIR